MSLHREFERAVRHGWLAHFIEAADRYGHAATVLMGMASRETNMGGRELSPGVFEWLEHAGDSGHGYGLMQVDSRTDPQFARSGAWKYAGPSILKGAEILSMKRARILGLTGLIVDLTDSKRHHVTFTMPTFEPDMLERVTIAAYNCGLWSAYHASLGRDPDRGTTGKNYSADVLARAAVFRELLDAADVKGSPC
jgi:hypothetical protein